MGCWVAKIATDLARTGPPALLVDGSTSLWTDPLLRGLNGPIFTIVRAVVPRRELLNSWTPGSLGGCSTASDCSGRAAAGCSVALQRSRRAWRGRVHPHCVDGSTSLWTDPLLRRLTRSTFIVRAVPAAEGAAESLGSGVPRRLFLGECLFREGRCGVLGRVGEDRDGPGVDGSTSLLWTGPSLRGLIHSFED